MQQLFESPWWFLFKLQKKKKNEPFDFEHISLMFVNTMFQTGNSSHRASCDSQLNTHLAAGEQVRPAGSVQTCSSFTESPGSHLWMWTHLVSVKLRVGVQRGTTGMWLTQSSTVRRLIHDKTNVWNTGLIQVQSGNQVVWSRSRDHRFTETQTDVSPQCDGKEVLRNLITLVSFCYSTVFGISCRCFLSFNETCFNINKVSFTLQMNYLHSK